ncbi:hypothetical protein B0H13DRAFT_2005720 [Mycena leptocephala]|nr:hypothetical protein B0H13DRAFT_2005720 [Mycena leptocephala]
MTSITRIPSSRIPVPRSITAPATPMVPNTSKSSASTTSIYPSYDSEPETTYYIDDEKRIEALTVRLTCTTPTFNQSTKLSNLASGCAPTSPMMHRGQGICNLPRYTDYKTALEDDSSVHTSSSSSSLSRKPSRFRLRASEDDGSSAIFGASSSLIRKPSRFRLRAPEDDSFIATSDASSSLSRKPSRFLRMCRSKASLRSSDGSSDGHSSRVLALVPPPLQPKFKIRRTLTPDSDSSDSSYSASTEEGNALQIVGPNVFIAYDDDSIFALTSAFTHIIRLTAGTGTLCALRSDVTFEPETGVHTLYLPIPSPVAPPHMFSAVSAIDESHGDIQFTSSLPDPSQNMRKIRARRAGDRAELPSNPAYPSYNDLVATQEFLAASGRVVSLPELAYFLSDPEGPTVSDAPPLGLQLTQIDMVLSFLRPHPFAPAARRRVLVMTPRGQLALEGLALMACYLARVEGCSVRFALRKFEGSVGTVSKSWRGLLGGEGVIVTYLEKLLLA